MPLTLSERYITDRFLPDKAIDLLDEACALLQSGTLRSSVRDIPSCRRSWTRLQAQLDELTESSERAEVNEDLSTKSA